MPPTKVGIVDVWASQNRSERKLPCLSSGCIQPFDHFDGQEPLRCIGAVVVKRIVFDREGDGFAFGALTPRVVLSDDVVLSGGAHGNEKDRVKGVFTVVARNPRIKGGVIVRGVVE